MEWSDIRVMTMLCRGATQLTYEVKFTVFIYETEIGSMKGYILKMTQQRVAGYDTMTNT